MKKKGYADITPIPEIDVLEESISPEEFKKELEIKHVEMFKKLINSLLKNSE